MGRAFQSASIAGLLCASALSLSGCSHAGNITAMATDYNRAIADARSEQVLLNVVRASGREPLQFTAFGEIAATVNRSIGIDTVATNLIAGGRDAISPTLRLSGATVPVVKIAPLSSREFTDGFLRPITPEVLHLFLSQGWDGEFLLPLVVGSFSCNGGRQFNAGDTAEGARIRDRLAAAGDGFRLRLLRIEGEVVTLNVSSEQALELLRSGAAPGHTILGVAPGSEPGTSVVRIRQPDETRWIASSAGLCEGMEETQMRFETEGEASIQLRSPDGIIYFLGEAFRPCYLGRREGCDLVYHKADGIRYLFRIRTSPPPSGGAAIEVERYGSRYWIPRLDAQDSDRTLKTVAFLNQLIALQTHPSSLNVSPTLISVPSG